MKNTDKAKQSKIVLPNDSGELTFKWSQIEPIYKQVIKEASKNLKMNGFRKGKVPTKVAEKQLDKKQVIGRVIEILSPKEFSKEIKKNKDLAPISRPQAIPIQTEKGRTWKIRVEFAQRSKVKLGNYKSLVKKAKKSVKKKDKKQSEQDHNTEILNVVFRELIKTVQPPVQEILIREQTQYKLQEITRSLEKLNMTVSDYLTKRKLTSEQLLRQLSAESLGYIQLQFILEEIARTAKITVSQIEIDKTLEGIKDKKVKELYSTQPQYQNNLKKNLLRQKITDHLLQI